MAFVYDVPCVLAVNTYCCTCLSVDRKLTPFSEIPLLTDWKNIGLNHPNGFICWECRAMFMKILQFREQVIYASQWVLDGKRSIQSLSKLSVTVSDVMALEITETLCEFDIKLEVDHIVPKDEPVEYTEGESGDELKLEGQHSRNKVNERTDVTKISIHPSENQHLPQQNDGYTSYFTDFNKESLSIHKPPKKRPARKEYIEYRSSSNSSNFKSKYSVVPIARKDLLKYYDLQQKFYWRDSKRVDIFRCRPCLLTFENPTLLEKHQKQFHDEVNKYICDVCSCRFEDQVSLNNHTNTHNSIYKCHACRYKHTEEASMINHCKLQHYKESYVCKLCNAEFRSRWKLGTHQAIHRDKGLVECDICKKLMCKRGLKSHINTVHATPESHECPICKKLYTSANSLEHHKKNYHGDGTEYYCSECSKSFGNMRQYQEHMTKTKKHNNFVFKCDVCKKTYLTELKLQRHTEAVHLRLNRFTCDLCGMSFSLKYVLRSHIKRKHDKNYKKPPKDKVCDVCGKAFMYMRMLAAHYRRHTGEKPYKCDVCGTDFRHQGSLYTHKKLVHLKLKRNRKKATAKSEKNNE